MRVAVVVAFAVGCSSSEPAVTATREGVGACPPGTHLEADACRPNVVLDCPAGTQFRDGIGCVAIVAEPTATARTTSSAPPTTPTAEPVTPVPSATASAQLGPCGCPTNDLACLMRCGPQAPPLSTASRTGEFDRALAANALTGAARAAQVCRRIPGPTGPGSIVVIFQPSGTVLRTTVREPYQGTPTGDCVEKLFQQATEPAYKGDPEADSKTFRI
ncbi:MAG: hypothetical protein HOV80_22425, partial [Polyangiaceae bacterium]|nr:hypothetical protein [Polyangiaceae bacterium]